MNQVHQEHISFIWTIANLLRGPYRPPQYRKVMLPMIVLRRMDCVLQSTKNVVIKKNEELKKKKIKEVDTILKKTAGQNFYNTSPLTFEKMVAAPENIAQDFKSYIKSFSPNALKILERFKFEEEIDKLDDVNRLFQIMKEFAVIDFSPERVSNIAMGYIFEELIRKFNEQANEEAGDHFTPREVIWLKANLLYAYDDDVFNQPGRVVKIYDPACGTGGMLSVSEEYIRDHSEGINVELFGQEYNDESWAICCSDMLIKGENSERIIFGDTFGDGKTEDGYTSEKFHYMLANPPFGVEWKPEEVIIRKEYDDFGFNGRFGAGLPRINDGSLLFLQHMISKMEKSPEEGGRGSRISIVFNGSPLFTGDAGSGESNIRRWIIENDWLEAVIALPDQLFYNTGIYTYLWIVSNRKIAERKGKVQLINASTDEFYRKMRKSLGNKRNELTEEHIAEITRIYGRFAENKHSKIFKNSSFGYIKIIVERPLRLNFEVTDERIERLWEQSGFASLAESKKRKDKKEIQKEIAAGEKLQQDIIACLKTMDSTRHYKNREEFLKDLNAALKKSGLTLDAPVKKAVINAISERDPEADICRDKHGNPEPDPELRDSENVPLPDDAALPLPLDYGDKVDNSELVKFVKDHCEEYMKREVLPHIPDAWVDYKKTKVGYEIPLNRHFYEYVPPRPLDEIEADIKGLEQDIVRMLAEVTG